MESFKFLSREEEKKLSVSELKEYYQKIRKFYQEQGRLNDNFYQKVHKVYTQIAKILRHYDIELRGIENIPLDTNVIFACNHSNSHDYYNLQEVLPNIFYALSGEDTLNKFSKFLLKLGACIFIDRNDKESSFNGRNMLIEKSLQGKDILIFPEATWCIHPAKLLLPMHTGVIKIASITQKPIIPLIMEYIDTDLDVKKEKDLIKKCIIQIGTPIYVNEDDNPLEKLSELREQMATIKWHILEEQPPMKREDIDFDVYENHLNLRMNTAMFKYDVPEEQKFIFNNQDYVYNEYPVNRVFVKKYKK